MIDDLRQVLPLRLQLVTLFLFVMWLFFQAYQPWEAIDQDLLLATGGFNSATDLSDWQRANGQVSWSDDTGYVSLKPAARLRYELPVNNGDLLLASGRIRTLQLEAGKTPWHAARIMLYFEDEQGQVVWRHPHDVGYLSGERDWQQFTAAIRVPAFAQRGWLELAHYGKDGLGNFDDISVRPAVWKSTYTHWRMFFGMLWAAMLMWLVLQTQIWSRPWGKSLLACTLLIVIGVTLPPTTMFQVASSGARLSESVLQGATEVLPEKTPTKEVRPNTQDTQITPRSKVDDAEEPVTARSEPAADAAMPGVLPSSSSLSAQTVQKAGHTLLFGILGFVVFMGFLHVISPGILVYSLLLFALSTEVLQLVVDGRRFGLGDMLLDCAGIIFGFAAAWIFSRVRNTRRLV